MKFLGWLSAALACFRERQFWLEASREAFYLITGSSSGLGVALTAAALAVGHRVIHTAGTMVLSYPHGDLAKHLDLTISANTNA